MQRKDVVDEGPKSKIEKVIYRIAEKRGVSPEEVARQLGEQSVIN